MKPIKPCPLKTEFLLEDRTHLKRCLSTCDAVMLFIAFPSRLEAGGLSHPIFRMMTDEPVDRLIGQKGPLSRTKFRSSAFHQVLSLKYLPGISSLITFLQ